MAFLSRSKTIVSNHFVLLLGTVLAAGIGAGCTYHAYQPASLTQSPAYDIPARMLLAKVKQIVESPPISLAVHDEQDGTFVTGWLPFRGEFHIVRYWYERTRFHVTIVPDFDDPAGRSRIQVTDETQQRPEESGPNQAAKKWSPAPELHRPQRSAQLLGEIESQLRRGPVK